MMSVSSVPQFAPVGLGVKPESSKNPTEAKLTPREEGFAPSAEASIPSSPMADLALQPDSFQSSQASTETTPVTPEASTLPATEQGWTSKQKLLAGAGATVALLGGLVLGGSMKNLPNTAEDLIKAGKELGIELVEKGKNQVATVTKQAETIATEVTAPASKGGFFGWVGQGFKNQAEKATSSPGWNFGTALAEGATFGAGAATVATTTASLAAGALTAPAWVPIATLTGVVTGFGLLGRVAASRFVK